MLPFLLALCGAAASAPQFANQGAAPEKLDGNRLAQMDVFADRRAIRPGERFSLGIRFRVEPKWHIYWENPGDSGYPTSVDIRAPAGFEVGRARHPAPERLELPGDIVTFVHEGEVVLLVDVVAPATLAAGGEARFEVDGRWLACIEVCLPGSKSTALVLPVAAAGSETQTANDKLFAQARERLPRPYAQLQHATTTWSSVEGRHVFELSVPESSSFEFFPRTSDVVHVDRQRVEHDGTVARLVLDISVTAPEDGGKLPEAWHLDGVVRVKRASGDAAFELTVPIPQVAGSARREH